MISEVVQVSTNTPQLYGDFNDRGLPLWEENVIRSLQRFMCPSCCHNSTNKELNLRLLSPVLMCLNNTRSIKHNIVAMS